MFERVCKIEAPQESLISYAGPIAIAPVVFNIMPIEIDGFGHAGAGAGQEQQERLEMPRRRVDLLSRSDRGGQASCRSAAAACRSRVGYVAALRGAPVFLSTKDGPTPIAVARMVARLKRLVWRVPSGWARSRVDPRHDLHIRASWHYALNRDLLALALQQEGAGRVSRRSKGTRTYCRPAMMRRSIGFSAGTRRAPIRRRPRQGLDTQRRFRQRHTLHTGGGHRLNPCRAHRRARDCDRRVAQWQSTPPHGRGQGFDPPSRLPCRR